MNFIAPAAAALGALSIPIFLLYMLRLRRTEMPISSNFLWQQLVRDREANAPWQRLRFSWLLLLQLLILLALVLALMRPFIEVETISAGRIVLLLDASASMNATDVNDSRFEEAKNIARDVVDTLGGDDTMTVIRVTDVPEVLISSSQDSTVLRAAISDAQPGESSADWAAALTLAAAGARGAEELDVVIVSDGGLSGSLPEIPGEIRLVTVGEQNQNLAISAMAAREVPGTGPQLFAQVTNYGDQDADVIFDITLDGELYNAQRYSVSAGRHIDVIVDNLPETFRTLTAGLSAPAASSVPDYLPLDDTAYTVRVQHGAGQVLLVTPRNIFLSQIFSSLPGVQLTQVTPEQGLPSGSFDLYVFDGWLPDQLPDGDMFIINPPQSTELFRVTGHIEDINESRVTAVRPEDPRTQYLDFDNVNVRAFQNVTPIGDWADILVDAAGGALLIAGEVESNQIAILTFALQDSDLPLQLTYPILIANLTQWYTPPRALNLQESIIPGTAVAIRPLNGDAVRITRPDQEQVMLELGDAPQVVFADTTKNGIYMVDILESGETIATEAFAVNLFSATESRITPQDSVTVGTTTISEAVREEVGQRELWQYLALLGLLILMLEWLYYHRTGVRQVAARVSMINDNQRRVRR
ncbi:MAG TPA: VWA domain-containing protein [Aggregatilineales bacterium]|nr:VWA domain-containing protein [Aggregatilineales bacterium]